MANMHMDTDVDILSWCFVALLLAAMVFSVSLLTLSVLAHADGLIEPPEPRMPTVHDL